MARWVLVVVVVWLGVYLLLLSLFLCDWTSSCGLGLSEIFFAIIIVFISN